VIDDPDFDLTICGLVYILTPISNAAQDWVIDHIQTEPMNEGDSVIIDEQFIARVINSIQREGMSVE
jgi:hypothetical protein